MRGGRRLGKGENHGRDLRAQLCPADAIQFARRSLYDGIGHAPFWEDTARFNAELAGFVRAANKTN